MPNPFESLPFFIGALFDHFFTLLAGCVVTVLVGILEKRVLKRPISVKWEVGVLLCFVLFACFQTWREQYRLALQVPMLSARVKDQDAEILNLKTNPPHVEVNLPAPVVNFPPQMAYIASYDTGIVAPSYTIGGHVAVSSGCKNLSTAVVAQKVSCVISLHIVDSKFDSVTKVAFVSKEAEEKTWREFQKDLLSTPISYKDYGPTEGDFKSVWAKEVLDETLDKAFVEQKKTLMLMGEYKWTDGLGEHTNDYCVWVQNAPGLFTPGAITPNFQFAWHSCTNHYGLKQ